MSNSKLLKYLERPLVSKPISSQPVLISNSIGNSLRKHFDLLKLVKLHVRFECRPGARFPDFLPWIERTLPELVKQHGRVTLYIWLGTCDLTKKNGKFIDFRYVDHSSCVRNITYYIDLFRAYIRSFPEVTPIFLEIPPYSIVEWNKSKGHSDPEIFREKDKTLSEIIGILNDYIRQVNDLCSVFSPKYKLDTLRYRKEKGKSPRISFNFSLYLDGIHPDHMLSRVWLKRLIENIFIHC